MNIPELKKENLNVLVVDDNAEIREILSEILVDMNYNPIHAEDISEGYRILLENDISLVITDYKLPDGSGIDLLQKIKLVKNNIPVIVITGFPSLDLAVDAMKKGAADFITKPFNIDQIQIVVQKTMQESQLILENQYLLAELNQKAIIEKLNTKLNEKVDELTKLQNINEAVNVFMDNEKLYTQIVQIASVITDAQKVILLIYDSAQDELFVRKSFGTNGRVHNHQRIKMGYGIAGKTAQIKKAFRVKSELVSKYEPVSPFSIDPHSSILSIPVFIGKDLFGVLYLAEKKDGRDFTLKDEKMMLTLSDKAGIRIENNTLYEGIYMNLLDTLGSLISTIEAKDSYTKQHSQRVTDYAIKIAETMSIPAEQMDILQFGGFLHDIGKIGIRDSVLNKEGKLTDEEFALVKQHPLIGVKIVEPLCLIDEEKYVIRHHHERWDGRGYPDGLKGDAIPLLARILTVADTFDAMTSTRPYRKAMSRETAVEEMLRCSGSQFDPEVIDAFMICRHKLEEKETVKTDVPEAVSEESHV